MRNVRGPAPGPRAPRLVQLARLMRREESYLEVLHQRHGDAFVVHFERRPWTVLAHPDLVKDVFTASPEVVHAGDGNEILRTPLGSHSVLLLDGKEHLRQRKLLLPPFHGERLAAQRERMERAAAAQVLRFPPGRAFSLRPHTTKIALEIILDVVLGADAGEEHDRLEELLERMLEWYGVPSHILPSLVFGPDHRLVVRPQRAVLDPVDHALYRLIAERRGAADLEEREDVLSMLLLARDEDGNGLTDAELRDELVTLMVAGHETTATALAWAYERLTRNPEALAALAAEARAGEATEYAEAVSRETLRLRPVLNNVVRTLHGPLEVGGVTYPRGTVLAPSIFLVHRRADLYPDPLAFRPERWLGVTPGTYSWIPFGGGVRRCIGAQFALLEMEVVLHAIARSAHLEPVGADEAPVARFITSSPARGGEVRVAGEPAGAGSEPLVAVA